MKVFLISAAVAVALAVAASVMLQTQQTTVVEAYSTEGARIDDPGHNLVSEWR